MILQNKTNIKVDIKNKNCCFKLIFRVINNLILKLNKEFFSLKISSREN